MHVSRLVRRGAGLLPLLALSACGEPATAPSSWLAAPEATALLSASHSGRNGKPKRVKAHKTYDSDSKNTIYTFTIDPTASQLVRLGDHTVVLPANVICDPSTSSYGRGEWEKPCARARAPITFRAIAGTRQGHAAIEFEPDVRFTPASDRDADRWVVLTLRDTKKLRDDKAYSILWWDADAESKSGKGSEKGAWIDEAATDPSLRAWTDRRGNNVSRRLKHFSGFNVTSGRSEEQ